jgi:hypothetical protein
MRTLDILYRRRCRKWGLDLINCGPGTLSDELGATLTKIGSVILTLLILISTAIALVILHYDDRSVHMYPYKLGEGGDEIFMI